jgi:hypothetical protein
MAVWAVGGLETLPVALLLTAGVLELARSDGGRPWVAALAMGALPWLRPEGLAAVAVLVVLSEARGLLRPETRRPALRRFLVLAGVPVLSQVLVEVFRLTVYGHLLPNSVLYKTGSGEQFTVLEKFVDQSTPVLLAAAVGLLVARSRQRVLIVPPAIYALGSIGTLDSVNSFSRFLLPVWPLIALLGGLAVAAVSRRLGRARVAVAAAAALLAVSVVYSPDADMHSVRAFSAHYASCKQAARSDAAAWLRDTTPEGSTFALSDVGLVPAQAGGRSAIDQFMLNDPLIQRTGPLAPQRRVNIVLGRHPDALILVSTRSHRFEPRYFTDAQLTRDPRFRSFRLAHVARGGPSKSCGYNLFIYERRALAAPERLSAGGAPAG